MFSEGHCDKYIGQCHKLIFSICSRPISLSVCFFRPHQGRTHEFYLSFLRHLVNSQGFFLCQTSFIDCVFVRGPNENHRSGRRDREQCPTFSKVRSTLHSAVSLCVCVWVCDPSRSVDCTFSDACLRSAMCKLLFRFRLWPRGDPAVFFQGQLPF